MDKETLVIDDVANNDSFNILLSLEGDPFEEYKETDKNVKELYFDNDDKKLYELNQITSPKENDKSVSESNKFTYISCLIMKNFGFIIEVVLG